MCLSENQQPFIFHSVYCHQLCLQLTPIIPSPCPPILRPSRTAEAHEAMFLILTLLTVGGLLSPWECGGVTYH